jgi:hypothetical protein
MKSRVISFRVNEDVLNLIERICERDGVSKNELLSDIISSNINMQINNNNLTNLEKLLIKLKSIVMHDYNSNIDVDTPSIIKGNKDDGEYEGVDLILVGDDTEIREKDGKFYVFDFNDEEAEPLLLTENEILDFYKGQEDAYNVPSMNDGFSYHYMRGYHKVMSCFHYVIKAELEEHNK